jgi:hypothetical protein
MWFYARTSSIGTWMQIVTQGWLVYHFDSATIPNEADPNW